MEQKGVDLSHVKIAKSVLVSRALLNISPRIRRTKVTFQTLWGLSKYSHFTKANKDLASKFKAALHLPHGQTEQEKSDEVRQNADREEKDHQERMRKVREVEREPSGDGKEAKVQEALFGDGGLEAGRHSDMDIADGEGEQRVRDAVEEEEDRIRRRDQRDVKVDG